MLVVAHGQRDLEILVGMQTRGVFEVAVAQRAGFAQHGYDFLLSRNEVHRLPFQLAPCPMSTWGMVRSRIFQSSASDQLSMYCISSFIQVSKSTLSRPEMAHRQVRPGRMRRRRRCQRWYRSTSLGTAGRGPTSDMSPHSTFHNCGRSSMENFRRWRPMEVRRGSSGILKTVPRV